jgi:hypothetical protein
LETTATPSTTVWWWRWWWWWLAQLKGTYTYCTVHVKIPVYAVQSWDRCVTCTKHTDPLSVFHMLQTVSVPHVADCQCSACCRLSVFRMLQTVSVPHVADCQCSACCRLSVFRMLQTVSVPHVVDCQCSTCCSCWLSLFLHMYWPQWWVTVTKQSQCWQHWQTAVASHLHCTVGLWSGAWERHAVQQCGNSAISHYML